MTRRPALARAALVTALFAAALPAAAEIYRWTDAEGREHFSMHLADVPESQRAAAAAATRDSGGTLSSFDSAPSAKPHAPHDEAVSGVSPLPPAAPAPVGSAESAIGGRTEMAWRSDAQSHLDAIARAEASLEACQARDQERRMNSGLTPLDACADKERAVERAEEAHASFEELARSKAVPPGWLR